MIENRNLDCIGYNEYSDNLFCQYCGKQWFTKNSLLNHERRCVTRPQFIRDLDDDGELYSKYAGKVEDSEERGIECKLTFREYCQLVQEAGIKSSDIGWKSKGKYVLARYNDQGGYESGNCRFITHKDNMSEQSKVRRARRRKEIISQWNEALLNGQSIVNGHCSLEEHLRSEDVLEIKSFDGENNSQYNTFWITDGENNKKWRAEYGDLPAGFKRGRTVSPSYHSSPRISGKGTIHITNGTVNKRWDPEKPIPVGFRRGLTKNRKQN